MILRHAMSIESHRPYQVLSVCEWVSWLVMCPPSDGFVVDTWRSWGGSMAKAGIVDRGLESWVDGWIGGRLSAW